MDLETEEKDCRNCGNTEWAKLGFVPAPAFLEVEGEQNWARVSTCLSCGATETEPPTQEEVDEAIDQYIDILDEYELVSESDIEMLRQ